MKLDLTFPNGEACLLGYPNYIFDKLGRVYNVRLQRYTGTKTKNGYINNSVRAIGKPRLSTQTHRLIAMVYIPTDDLNLHINHINKNREDNRIVNLEWVTLLENNEYSGKCIPMTVIDPNTLETTHFESATECARVLGSTKDTILYRSLFGGRRVFECGNIYVKTKLYKKVLRRLETGFVPDYGVMTERPVLVKNVETLVVKRFSLSKDAASYVGLSGSGLYKYLNNDGQPLLKDSYLVKYEDSPEPWRDISDLSHERHMTGDRSIVIIDKDENIEIYKGVKNYAREIGMNHTTLVWRLKSEGQKTYSDGKRYMYYDHYCDTYLKEKVGRH